MDFEFNELLKQIASELKKGNSDELFMDTKEFNTPVQQMVSTGWVSSDCADILFINITPLLVTANGQIEVNNYPLDPGGYIGFSGNNAEKNVDRYNVVFGTAATKCIIVKRMYNKTLPNNC
jgi:hypothetical protein